MKKFLVAAALLVTSAMAMAETCHVDMVARNGRSIDKFSSYDYNFEAACRQALRQCTREQDRRSYDRVVARATCSVTSRRPVPPPHQRKEFCSFNLVNTQNGRVVNTFTAQANNEHQACRKADDKCFDARYTKQNPWKFSCEKVRGGSRPPRPNPTVTRFCTVDRITNGTISGRVVQTYTSSATARTAYEAESRACQKATSDCAMDARYSHRRDTCMRRY